MKLLLDQNLSYRLVKLLNNNFPGTEHADNIGLDDCSDIKIWQFAKKNKFVIVTQDSDFFEFGLYDTSPALVIWLRCGNRSTTDIANLLNVRKASIEEVANSSESWCLEVK